MGRWDGQKTLKNHICMAPYINFAKSFFILSVSLRAFLIYFHMLTNMHHNFYMQTNNLIKTSYVNEQCTMIFICYFSHFISCLSHFISYLSLLIAYLSNFIAYLTDFISCLSLIISYLTLFSS